MPFFPGSRACRFPSIAPQTGCHGWVFLSSYSFFFFWTNSSIAEHEYFFPLSVLLAGFPLFTRGFFWKAFCFEPPLRASCVRVVPFFAHCALPQQGHKSSSLMSGLKDPFFSSVAGSSSAETPSVVSPSFFVMLFLRLQPHCR